jgi:hypothetical protein
MTTNDLIAMLHEAMCELDVMGSYAYDADVKWPSYGLKVTSVAHKKLAERIKALLDTGLRRKFRCVKRTVPCGLRCGRR